jgi:subtilisin family serine protease
MPVPVRRVVLQAPKLFSGGPIGKPRLAGVVASGMAGMIAVVAFAAPSLGAPGAADPVRDAEWHLSFLNVAEAHTYSEGSGITVGVVDTGVDATHPDLVGSILPGHDFTGATDDGREDLDGHGTAMVGLIAAHGRILGIAPQAKILPVRFVESGHAQGSSGAAIEWAVNNGARVLRSTANRGSRHPGGENVLVRGLVASRNRENA